MNIVALDIGGTSIKSGRWVDGVLQDIKEIHTNATFGGSYVIERAIKIIQQYADFDRIGISTAGQVDSKQGIIKFANSNIPGYTGMKVKEIIEKQFQVPVAVENDVNAAAIGEATVGAGKEFNQFLCLTYGTGVGGAIVINQSIYTGHSYSAGEFGAIVVHANERIEGDYFSGCYERYASATALIRRAKEFDKTLTDGRKIFERIKEKEIQGIVDSWIQEIIYGLTTLIHIFNPPCIILGGGILSQLYIIEKLNQCVYNSIMPSFHNVILKQAELGNQAGLLGAVYLAKLL